MPRLDSGKSVPAFGLLVKRLQESLSRMEEFEVQLAAQNASDGEFDIASIRFPLI